MTDRDRQAFEQRRKAYSHKLANARKHIDDCIKVMARRAKLINEWRRTERYLEEQLARTFEDVMNEKAERAEAAQRVKVRKRTKGPRLIADKGEEV